MFAPLLKVPKPKAASRSAPTRAPKLPQHLPHWLGGSLSSIPAHALDRLSRPEAPSPFWQPKLAIGRVDDPLEQEADRVADQVMRVPATEVASTSTPLQVSRKCAEREKLRTKLAGPQATVGEAPAIVHEVLQSPGQPLDAATRAYFEPRFGHDFGRVRVHSGAAAEQSARDVNADAYTVGHNVVLGAGRFTPATEAGRRLIAHELAHVVQQSGAAPFLLQRSPSPNPGLTVTPIPSPNPGLTVTPILAPGPKVAWVSKQRQTVDGKQIPDTERMRVGERLIVRVMLQHVELAALRTMGSTFITNALTRESLAVEDTGVIQINFRATKIGAEHAEIRFALAGTEQVVIPVETHVEMGEEDFRKKLAEASQYRTVAHDAADLYYVKASPPYRDGWENVKKTLDKAGEGNPFNEIVVHLAVTFIAGLAGGKTLEVLKHLGKGEPLTEGLKELTILVTEAGAHAVMPKAAAIPLEPADWVDAAHVQILTEVLAVDKMLEDMETANNENRKGFFRDFDVVAAVHNTLQRLRSLETAVVPKAEDFEKMVWKGWMAGYTGRPDINDADAWLVIINRIRDIGEDPFEFLKANLR